MKNQTIYEMIEAERKEIVAKAALDAEALKMQEEYLKLVNDKSN